MTKYKLINTIKKDLLRKKFKNIKVQKFSYKYIRELFEKYYCVEYCYFWYCCYGEDRNCWIDEESCWMRERNMTDKELNDKIMHSFFRLTRSLKESIYKRHIIISEKEDIICISLPCRDLVDYDIYLSFKKN